MTVPVVVEIRGGEGGPTSVFVGSTEYGGIDQEPGLTLPFPPGHAARNALAQNGSFLRLYTEAPV